MSKDKPWLKMWTEWLGDAKMDRLSLAEQGAWWRLVSLAHDCGHTKEVVSKRGTKIMLDGALIVAGTPLSMPEILKSLKISEESDKDIFTSMVKKMEGAGSLAWVDGTLHVVHYEERQRAATDTKDAQRQRTAAWREKQKTEQEKREPEKSPSPEDEEGERKNKEAEEETQAPTCNGKSVTPSDIIVEVTRLIIENKREPLSEVVADRIRQFADEYTGPLSWIEKAFKQAAVHKRRWDYVQKIIERWEDEGGPDDERERKEVAGGERKQVGGAAADRGNSSPDWRNEWKVKRSGPGTAAGGEDNR